MRFFAAIWLCLCLSLSCLGLPLQTAARPSPNISRPSSDKQPPAVALPSEPGEYAIFYTTAGTIVCRLFPEDAPKAVANFVGLARGTKPWTNPQTGKVMHTPLYSNTVFHRVIPGFMIQGGDPEGTGEGDPGYKFDDEISPNHHFDKAGILAMANAGPNTNGSQFFITVAPADHLEGHYSIFGEVVSGQDVADAIAQAPRKPSDGSTDAATKDGLSDKPVTPVKLVRVVIKKVSASNKPAADTAK